MELILEWAKTYSTPVVVLLGFGAALVFVLRMIVEKAVEAQFDARNKRLELLLQRRSAFEEKILLDQYATVVDLQLRIKKIETDINRLRHGISVEGLMKGGDIIPLSEVYAELQAKRFMLKEQLYDLLVSEVTALISFANARDPAETSKCEQKILSLNTSLQDAMNAVFGIDRITWNSIGTQNNLPA